MLWVSHLAPSTLVVVTMRLLEGLRVALATMASAADNSFLYEADHVVGRMEDSGRKVALPVNMPGENHSRRYRSSLLGGANPLPWNVSCGDSWSTRPWRGRNRRRS